MKSNTYKLFLFFVLFTMCLNAQKFSGKATYISKSKMELGNWGAKLSEARKKQVAARLKNRLEKQFDEFGRQPEELARTKSYSYSVFNLSALVRSAIFAEIYGTDLSQQKGTASQLKLAIDYLIPFALDEKSWEYTQITGMNGSNRKMLLLLSYAQAKWPDERYENAIRSLRSRYPDSRYILTTSAFIRSQNEEKI